MLTAVRKRRNAVMNKIVRVLGKKGRITIPYALNIRSGNILSFDAKGNTITVTKEKLCDDCKSESEPLDSFVESLVLEERERLLKTLMRLKRKGAVKNV
jgi:bifunctional DNA-binding transcriptional regulator/antitoxin component of YhaV-PrlF toxin-antitoxin module